MASPRGRWRRWAPPAAMTAVVAAVVGLAVVWPGFDARRTPPQDTSVWALQTAEGRRYARVNTELRELETVKPVQNPSAVLQADGRALLFTDAGTRVARIDAASPPDFSGAAADALGRTPAGTVDVVASGPRLLYRTESGDVFTALGSDPERVVAVEPPADGGEGARPRLHADAATITPDGVVFAVSVADRRVVRADADSGRVLGSDPIDLGEGADVTVTAAGDVWAVLDAVTGTAWLRAAPTPVATGAGAGALWQTAGPAAETVYLADGDGLIAVGADGSERVVSATGAPAAPVWLADVLYAAWLPAGPGGGTLWTSTEGTRSLDYGGIELRGPPAPRLTGNGERLILNDTASGWVWSVPDGRLMASSQQWSLDEPTARDERDDLPAERVIDPKPPVAEPDAFGVRPGRQAVLPVLLNDHDPNEDVLRVEPDSVSGLDPAFGTAVAAGEDQRIVIAVAPGASGTATIQYRVSDGSAPEGLLSAPASVTISAVPDTVNSPPVWCGVEGCLAAWPDPAVNAGEAVTVPVLRGWVDPEGDPLFVADAATDSPGSVAADPRGDVVYQHPDPSAAASAEVNVRVSVADSRGATTQRDLTVSVGAASRLTAESFTVTGAAGAPLVVALAEHVSGATGPLSLASATVLQDAGGEVTSNPAALGFRFSAPGPGTYPVQYTVRDDAGEATGLARITVLDPARAAVSAAPLTAFVRPGQDTTVDIVDAVGNPAGLVLLAQDVTDEPAPGAALTVDAVGQDLIRLSGSTGDGRPGVLGVIRYRVSDGTGRPAGTTVVEMTAILLPAAPPTAPIAVDDTVTVRAGAPVDIPVLDNDVSPAGTLLAVDPSRVVNESEAGLAFATPAMLRYLAPGEPGTYAVGYTVYRMGNPALSASARVFVTVTSGDTNAAPAPRTMVGRVLAGSSVAIALDSYASDPDGDPVTLDRVLTQPSLGTAALAADRSAVVYTSTSGTSGQDTFTVRVRDTAGASSTATVRVGVLDASAPSAPVTFSDYVQVQTGGPGVVVRPAANDRDPAGGELELVEAHPNAPAGSAEYIDLEERLAAVEPEEGVVRIAAGSTAGTASFVYTVRTRAGDIAQGLIVVTAVRDPVPDYPVVRDTVLTTQTRERFRDGIDVLADAVTWTGGDAASLQVSLWSAPPDVETVDGRIRGPLPGSDALIAFQVTGTAFSGAPVVTYGFLRVPGSDDPALALRSSFPAVTVDEDGSTEFDLTAIVAVPPGSRLLVDTDQVRAGGARPSARCESAAGTTVTYTAGHGPPWNDTCIVAVRLATQDHDTVLAVPVRVIPADPQPELRAAAITLGPGQTTTYDLAQMTAWERHDRGSLRPAAAYGGDQFEVLQNGTVLTITAKDASRPGRRDGVVVTLPDHPDAAAATLTLTVGPAPSALPKGGTASRQCSQADGTTSCAIPVVGVPGEVNPLPRTPLELVSVTGPANCPGVSFSRADDSTVLATWSAQAPGAAACTGSFSVRDAQQRESAGDRDGQVILDLRGLPADPARVNWISYTGDSVSLQVVSDGSSYPAVTGYRVAGGGSEVICPATGLCPPIPATNGEHVQYQAWALNDVGSSRRSATVEAWAYRAPRAPTSVSAAPVPAGAEGGRADIRIGGIDPSTGYLTVTSPYGGSDRVATGGRDAVVVADFPVGANVPTTLTVTPQTRFDVPPASVAAGSAAGSTATVVAYGIGAPILDLNLVASADGAPGTVRAELVVTANGVDADLAVDLVTTGTCRPQPTGTTDSGTFPDTFDRLPLWQPVTVTACARYTADGRVFGSSTTSASATPVGPIAPPTGSATYRVASAPASSDGGLLLSWTGVTEPNLRSPDPFTVTYSAGGAQTTRFADLFAVGGDPGAIQARSCHPDFGCSDPVAVLPADGSAAYTAQVRFPASCTADGPAPDADAAPRNDDLVVGRTRSTDAAGTVSYAFTIAFAGRLTGLTPPASPYVVVCAPPVPAGG